MMWFDSLWQLDFDALCSVYGLSDNQQRNDFYDYLAEDFFRVKGAFYAVYIVNGRYVSALRAEPYDDGYLIEALQTPRELRNNGYAGKLLSATLECGKIPMDMPVYSHIHKKNGPSLSVHTSCGFRIYKDYAVFVDGSVYTHSYTLKKEG